MERFETALSRINTLRSKDAYANARGGTWALDELFRRASVTFFGIGLSRTGAASALWADVIQRDPVFGPHWSFADNLSLALFTELGVFGLMAYVSLFGTVFILLFRRKNSISTLVAFYVLVIFVSGYASEGSLYQPEASLFWTFVGIGFRQGGVT
jgi:hypothetical protein